MLKLAYLNNLESPFQIDIAITALTMTKERMEVMTYPIPVHKVKMTMITAKRGDNNASFKLNPSFYLGLFSVESWVSILSFVLVTSMFLAALELIELHDKRRMQKSIVNSIVTTLLLVLQRWPDSHSNCYSSRHAWAEKDFKYSSIFNNKS